MIGFRRIADWAAAIFLAAVFVAAGVSKLEGASAQGWAKRFERWGYPSNAHYVVGVVEILGGIGVLIPWARRVASLSLVAVMTGAACTHAAYAEYPRIIPPLVLGSLAFLVYWSHRRPAEEHALARGPGV
jgi:putative oxidoreductase